MLIYNWPPMYTGRHESGKEEQDFQQTYVFPRTGKKAPAASRWWRSSRLAQLLARALPARVIA